MGERKGKSSGVSRLTPMMRQYEQTKAQYPDALLLFRMGDFYEAFNEDAVRLSSILGITLTKRANGGAADADLAGFPYHALDTYLPKLVRAGQRVAICDQLEDPKLAKGLVKRGVTEVVTPGVTLNEGVLERGENNYLCVLSPDDSEPGVAFLDVSTGAFYVSQGASTHVDKLITTFSPKELLVPRGYWDAAQALYGARYYLSRVDDWAFSWEDAHARLLQQFGTQSLKGYGISMWRQGICAAGAALAYLNLTKHGGLGHITSISRVEEGDYVWLDRFTVRNLEIFHSSGEGGSSLLRVVDRTRTPMGGRLLRRWLGFPLRDLERIRARQSVVRVLHDADGLREELSGLLSGVGDLERMASRVASGRLGPREMCRLGESLALLHRVRGLLEGSSYGELRELGGGLDPCTGLAARVARELVADPPALGKGGVFHSGVSGELDELRSLRDTSHGVLESLRARESARTGIQNLKLGFNNVFGYYFEVRHAKRDQVPSDWTRKQTLVSAERYVSGELKELEDRILSSESRIAELELSLYQSLVLAAQGQIETIQRNAGLVARLDALCGFASLGSEKGWVAPIVDESEEIDIEEGWHPVISEQLRAGQEYIPNSVRLDGEEQQIMMITGPNMSGKSALLRQTALIVLLAQTGSFVPARRARLGVMDRIFTRVGASDNISAGESTFMVEMTESAGILHNLSSRSLVLLDEIGRGTSTYDGISIAWAMAEYIHDTSQGRAKTLFATHYHELNEMAAQFPRIRNYNVSVREVDGRVVFLRRLQPGGIGHSFGIHVARIAGMPHGVVSRASEVLSELESRRPREGLEIGVGAQATQVFEPVDPLIERIRARLQELDLARTTPLEALQELYRLRELAGFE